MDYHKRKKHRAFVAHKNECKLAVHCGVVGLKWTKWMEKQHTSQKSAIFTRR